MRLNGDDDDIKRCTAGKDIGNNGGLSVATNAERIRISDAALQSGWNSDYMLSCL